MGKGTVVSGGTGGYYSISVQLDATAIAARIVDLQARLVDLQSKITDAESTLDDLEDDLKKLLNEQDALIDAFAADSTADNLKAITEKSKEVAAAAAQVGLQRSAVAALVAEEASVRKEITRLSAAPSSVAAGAWCADYTEDLVGDVGVVTVPGGEREQHLQILPGYEGGAAYDAQRDGMLRQPFTDSAAATYYNLAMLPGWQRWLPRYRLATITAIDTDLDTCSITISPAISGQQGIDVNYLLQYDDVPIEYMSCNSSAFEVSDTVIVEFTAQDKEGIEGNWAPGKPKVIGFVTDPRPCETICLSGFILKEVDTDDENFIKLDGSLQPNPATPEEEPYVAGTKTWYSDSPLVWLSWSMNDTKCRYQPSNTNYQIFCAGKVLSETPASISGVAFNANRALLYYARISGRTLYIYSKPATRVDNDCCLEVDDSPWTWTQVGTCTWDSIDAYERASTDVFFNQSGTKCTFCTWYNRLGYPTEIRSLVEVAIGDNEITSETTLPSVGEPYLWTVEYTRSCSETAEASWDCCGDPIGQPGLWTAYSRTSSRSWNEYRISDRGADVASYAKVYIVSDYIGDDLVYGYGTGGVGNRAHSSSSLYSSNGGEDTIRTWEGECGEGSATDVTTTHVTTSASEIQQSSPGNTQTTDRIEFEGVSMSPIVITGSGGQITKTWSTPDGSDQIVTSHSGSTYIQSGAKIIDLDLRTGTSIILNENETRIYPNGRTDNIDDLSAVSGERNVTIKVGIDGFEDKIILEAGTTDIYGNGSQPSGPPTLCDNPNSMFPVYDCNGWSDSWSENPSYVENSGTDLPRNFNAAEDLYGTAGQHFRAIPQRDSYAFSLYFTWDSELFHYQRLVLEGEEVTIDFDFYAERAIGNNELFNEVE